MIEREIGLPPQLVEKLAEEGEITVDARFEDGHCELIKITEVASDEPQVLYGGRR